MSSQDRYLLTLTSASVLRVARADEDKLSDSGVDKHTERSVAQISRGGDPGVNS